MTNPTSNFGWQMPTSTDLVTDLPADFEVFGQAVDTSLADLKGGTTGQILSKTTSADMDFTWVTSAGDIEGVTAGTGISGGGTTGTVTITNSMATAIDAKGDLIPGTGADTFSRLAVGANGTVLTADSAETTGLKWVEPSSGSMTLIATATASASASITLGSIPATYKDLRVIIRNFRPETDNVNLYVRFNGVTGENYRTVDFATAQSNLGFTTNFFNFINGSDNGTQSSLAWLEIPDYTNTTTWKMVRSSMISNNSGTPANVQWANQHGYTNQTAAVNSITFYFSAGNITSGTFEVWGVK
jgi:hypothetical protein